MDNNDRHVADDHGRSRYVKTYSLILFQVGSVNSKTFKVQNDIKTLFGDHIKH